jgi:hypothetical protein
VVPAELLKFDDYVLSVEGEALREGTAPPTLEYRLRVTRQR